jgi:hypothetical protein
VVGLLTLAAQDEGGPAKALTATGADHIAASFREAVEHVVHAAQDAAAGKPATQSRLDPGAPAAADPKAFAARRSSDGAVPDGSAPAARDESARSGGVSAAASPSLATNDGGA